MHTTTSKTVVGLFFFVIATIKLAEGANTAISVLEYPQTQSVCVGDSVHAALTFRTSDDVHPKDIKIVARDHYFSEGTKIRGKFHFGDDQINRWTNKLSFQETMMTYEVWNSNIQSKDEFYCRLQIQRPTKNLTSDYFMWFEVDKNCTSETPQPGAAAREQLNKTGTDANTTENATAAEQIKQLDDLYDMRELANKVKESILKFEELISLLTNQSADRHNFEQEEANKMEESHLKAEELISLLTNQIADLRSFKQEEANKMEESHLKVEELISLLTNQIADQRSFKQEEANKMEESGLKVEELILHLTKQSADLHEFKRDLENMEKHDAFLEQYMEKMPALSWVNLALLVINLLLAIAGTVTLLYLCCKPPHRPNLNKDGLPLSDISAKMNDIPA